MANALGPDDEPQGSGAIVAIHHGDYRAQEIWVRSGANIGNWYPLGGEYGLLRDRTSPPMHYRWQDVLGRGPVTLLSPGDEATYKAGWAAGRQRMLEQMEGIVDD